MDAALKAFLGAVGIEAPDPSGFLNKIYARQETHPEVWRAVLQDVMKWMLDDADPEARDNGDLIATARSKDGRLLPIYLASLPRTPRDHDD